MLTSNMTVEEVLRELEFQGLMSPGTTLLSEKIKEEYYTQEELDKTVDEATRMSPWTTLLLEKIKEKYYTQEELDKAVDEATRTSSMKIMEYIKEEFGISFHYD